MMKRVVVTLIVLALALPTFAGGKSCQIKSGKSVELTGTLTNDSVFHVANSKQTYKVCEQTEESVLKLGNDGHDTLHVKGKVVNCGGKDELLINTANKI